MTASLLGAVFVLIVILFFAFLARSIASSVVNEEI